MVSPIIVPPPINQINPKYVEAGMEPKFVELYNKYNVGRLATHQVPIEEYRKDPMKYTIAYGRETVAFDGKTEDLKVPVEGGEIIVRYYVPKEALDDPKPRPTFIDFHGGGWVFGGLGTDDDYCKRVCNETGAIAFNVDYRLAPEFPFPTPLTDCWDAFNYIIDRADKFKVDKSRVAVGGCSAGGHLSAVIAHKARDVGIKICYQVLGVPCCDATAVTPDGSKVAPGCPYPSWTENYDNPSLHFDRMSWFYLHFLGSPRPAKYDNDPEVNVIQSTNFKDLAPAIIVTAEFDVLRDEGEQYGKLLQDNGVECEVVRMPGTVHPFMLMDDFLESGKTYNRITIAGLKKAFA
ncbi:unnamed protein product [Kuraishia capsulata CBS 1993]|uniref:Alpha/beta hydrolase fold-3 domain-containing protein n=1 Tax=Kuraishia capsulata CBS 1993 TaxID=1382522 RepID=W6MN80_9ASCO|nr:uncharacterized protein KUCA_T00004027001 [Kuraishia capsulata CBS 1993]CDK28046.1 unnamed protein product [Kuraishia capsulata CBS 1993]